MKNFGTQVRRQQKEFRDSSGTVSPEGRSSTDDKGRRNEHLLSVGYEEENLYSLLRGFAGAGAFLTAIRAALRAPGSFAMTSPEALVAAVRQGNAGTVLSRWLADQHERYGY